MYIYIYTYLHTYIYIYIKKEREREKMERGIVCVYMLLLLTCYETDPVLTTHQKQSKMYLTVTPKSRHTQAMDGAILPRNRVKQVSQGIRWSKSPKESGGASLPSPRLIAYI